MINVKWYDDGEPDFINEKGVKWWHVDLLTDHAARAGSPGIPCPDIKGWIIEMPGGQKEYVLTDDEDVIYGSPQLEAVSVQIDAIRLARA